VARVAEWWFKSFFEDYFTNERRANLMDPFLFEGCEIVYKIGLSILRFCELKSVFTALDFPKFEDQVKSICEKEVDDIIREAWDIKINKSVLKKYNEKFDPNTGRISIPRYSYIVRSWPDFEDGDSMIVSKKEFFGAWASLPHETHECSVSIIYTSDKDGCNLMSLRNKCRHKMHLLFFIETVENSRFGCYVRSIDGCEKFAREEVDLRLFSFTPALRAWQVEPTTTSIFDSGLASQSEQPSAVIFCDNKEFYVGDWSKKALRVLSMEDGYSQACKSLGSPVLVNDESGMFKILRFEAFKLSLFY